MEPGFYFTALVIGTGAFHLVSQIADHISKTMHSKSDKQNLSAKKAPKRDDWYVFFNCSDLTGKQEDTHINYPGKQQNKKSSSRRRRADKRTAARISYT